MMLITGWLSSRIGPKATLLVGLFVIILFSLLGGLSETVGQLVGYRAGWGLGNALFISTALAVIVSVASGGTERRSFYMKLHLDWECQLVLY
jgi:MFS family permease